METGFVLYDAGCGLCRWAVSRLLAWDRRGRLQAVALQDPVAAELLEGIEPGRRMASWHLVTPGGRVASGGAAAAPLLRMLPLGRAPAGAAGAFPGTVERLYGWVARHRHGIGALLGLRSCEVLPAARRAPPRPATPGEGAGSPGTAGA